MPKGQFDGESFYAALDFVRSERGKSWKQVANDSGVSASTLTRMAQGKRPDVDSLAALVAWSGLSANDFIAGSGTKDDTEPSSLEKVVAQFRADPKLPAEAKQAIEATLTVLYKQFARGPAE